MKIKKGGPLDGNGGTLSVAALMRSAQDAGEYRIVTYNSCGNSDSISRYGFYGGIDNLSITAWGSNAVSFRWSASGPRPAVTYEYAVTTQQNPDSPSITYLNTTDTVASATGLTAGVTYYIHIRVKGVIWNGVAVSQDSDCPEILQWETIRFVSCSGAAPIGSVLPANAYRCIGGTVSLTASGGNSYQWYDGNNSLIPAATSANYIATSAGQYRTYITTSAGCQGLVYSVNVIDTLLHSGNFFGGGVYCLGDSADVGISNTIVDQIYIIRKNGQNLDTVQGIGNPNEPLSPDTLWYKFRINSFADTGTYSIRTTSSYCSSGLDFGAVSVSTTSNPVTDIVVIYASDVSVDFKWSYPIAWRHGFEYSVTTDPVPSSGISTMNLFAFVPNLMTGKHYYIHIRPKCDQGGLSWTTAEFFTLYTSPPSICSTPAVATSSTPITVSLQAGTGNWNFAGSYPYNSTGSSSTGREKLLTFTPIETGVYYLDVTSATGTIIHYLYKRALDGCNNSGWTGIRAISEIGKYPVGMLQAGTQYLFILDNNEVLTGATHTFKICRSVVATPSESGCINTVPLPEFIPAKSLKEEYVIDTAGNLILALDFSAIPNDQTNISVTYLVNSGSLRKDIFYREYLDRSFTLNNGDAKIKFFFKDNELQNLINDPDDGITDVTSINDLNITVAGQSCSHYVLSYAYFLKQLANGNYGSDSHYIEFLGRNYGSSTYYFHAGNAALNQYLTLGSFEDFSSDAFPAGWSQQLISGPSQGNLSFVASSSTPSTSAYSEPRYVRWNSYNYSAGTETRLISPPIHTYGVASISVDFYWHHNNNPSYSSSFYLTEGVQVEYSLNGNTWIPAGSFIPRHDSLLSPGTGEWRMKRVTLPPAAGNHFAIYVAFKFRSKYGDDCGLDLVSFIQTPACPAIITGLSTTRVTTDSVYFNWSAVPGAVSYNYMTTPFSYITPYYSTTTGTNAIGFNLKMSESYYIHVRPECSPGVYGSWKTIRFTTAADTPYCAYPEFLSSFSPQTAIIPIGNGVWDFGAGAYPKNSVGYPTPGREKLYQFSVYEPGVYYLEVLSASGGYIDYFYKPYPSDCADTGWIGIDDLYSPAKRALGMLDWGTYYLLLDSEDPDNEITHTFRIVKATVAPAIPNVCINVNSYNSIPAHSIKEEYFLDNAGNVIAGFDFSNVTNDVGNLSLSYYVNNGLIRRDARNTEYLDRNFSVQTTNTPANPVGVKFFFTDQDLQRLINEPNDGIADVASVNDLAVSKMDQTCSLVINSASSVLLPQAGNAIYDYNDNSKYIRFNTQGFSSFYLHKGPDPLYPGDNQICPGQSVSFNMTSGGPGYNYQWQVNNGSGFQNIFNNATYSGATTSYLSVNNPPTSFNDYTYRCISILPNVDTLISAGKALKFIVTWKGSISSSWLNAANWDCGVVPDANTDVIIDNTGFAPVISSNVSCKSVFARQGANITVSPGVKLTITGH